MADLLEPQRHCSLCPRLEDFRADNRVKEPTWHNAPVASFGSADAELLIVGLAPGLRGANRTGRPFTGDAAGALLYPTLQEFGWASGRYSEDAKDRFKLVGCRITNAVRCVPPQNRPVRAEIGNCRKFLKSEMTAMRNLRATVALGTVAHNAILSAQDVQKSLFPFKHGAFHYLPDARPLVDTYHCSRYNVNTGRLTEQMFHDVFAAVKAYLSK